MSMILQYLGFTGNEIIDSDETDTEREEIGKARFYGVFFIMPPLACGLRHYVVCIRPAVRLSVCLSVRITFFSNGRLRQEGG